MRLSDKVAIVTGAGAKGGVGVGAAIAISFAREGCRVVVANRSAEPARLTAELIRESGGECITVSADVGRPEDCQRIVDAAMDAYQRIDILVNNAAVSDDAAIFDTTDDRWDAVFDVNVKGSMAMARSVAVQMRQGGSIINISSRSAERPLKASFAYATSKGAILALTKTSALQLASRDIRANALIVGGPWTPMAERAHSRLGADELAALRETRRIEAPIKREGTPWDVAKAALFFASDDSSWVTGQVLAVDGGYLLRDPAEAARDAVSNYTD